MKLLLLSLAGLALAGLRKPFCTANAEGLTGTHEKSRSYYTSAAIATRHLLHKQGADADHIAPIAATTDLPLGTVIDEATAAEARVAVQLLGRGPTKRMVAGGAIAAGVLVYVGVAGKVAAAGTVVVGVSLTAAAADNDVIEVNDR